MALAAFDSSFSVKQDAVARLGERAHEVHRMTAEQLEAFEKSPFMSAQIKTEKLLRELCERRDRRRAETDPAFRAEESDFKAPKAYNYDRNLDYYKVLGIDEFATGDHVNRAYRQLSLLYHPDKTQNQSQLKKDEAAHIFLEIKAAVKTLGHAPTRRQYDRDRDRRVAQKEVTGTEQRDRPQFDGTEALKKLEENKLPPGDLVRVPVKCRLEKFVYGGHKCLHRSRRVRRGGAFHDESMLYRLHVPRGVGEPFETDFAKKGDEHADRQADTLRFVVNSKPHELVERQWQDLVLREPVAVAVDVDAEPNLAIDFPYLRGRHLVLWGGNPFFRSTGTGTGVLEGRVWGAGVGEEGALRFRAQLARPERSAPEPAPPGQHGMGRGGLADAPAMLRRLGRWREREPVCPLELRPSGPPVELFTKPSCCVRFYDNSDQVSGPARAGCAPPRLCFAVTLVSQACSRSGAAHDWRRLRTRLVPLLQAFGWALIPRARDSLLRTIATPVDFTEDGELPPVPPDLPPHSRLHHRFLCEACNEVKTSGMKGDGHFYTGIYCDACWDLWSGGSSAGGAEDGHHDGNPDAEQAHGAEIGAAEEFGDTEPGAEPEEAESRPVPWRRMGNDAFARGDYWLAMTYYSKAMEEPDVEPVDAARILSNRAACWACVGCHEASLEDAKQATKLDERWWKPWSRVGLAAARLGDADGLPADKFYGYHWEARAAFSRAVELHPTVANMDALDGSVRRVEEANAAAAREAQERAREALAEDDHGGAIAEYTTGLAMLPPMPEVEAWAEADGKDAEGQAEEGEHAALRRALFADRAATLLLLRDWGAAMADGQRATAACCDSVKARCHLGAALLACRRCEDAYAEFAKALQQLEHRQAARNLRQEEGAEPSDGRTAEESPAEAEAAEARQASRARKGREASLLEMLNWRSVRASSRVQARFSLDLYRPRGLTKVFAVSDLHLDEAANEDWVHSIDDVAFQDDVLIVAGNVAQSLDAIVGGLTALKAKFRRVFYTVGNHEMWIGPSEAALYPDSVAKFNAILAACDALGVDVTPAPIARDVFILPLFSWCNAEFDEGDPFPDPRSAHDTAALWPMDRHETVWRYMLELNKHHLRLGFRDTVITFSHFLPARWVYHDPPVRSLRKTVGCEGLEEQLRSVRSRIHVFGHTHQKFSEERDGCLYVQNSLGFASERQRAADAPTLTLVFDGQRPCTREWNVDGSPPPGFVKKVQHVEVFRMPGLRAGSAEWSQLQEVVERYNRLPGITAIFCAMGTSKRELPDFCEDADWDELLQSCGGFTHALLLVANGVEEFKGWWHSRAHQSEWERAAGRLAQATLSVDCQLGMDIAKPRSDEPFLMICILRLHYMGPEHYMWEHINKCLEWFNGKDMPGLKASFMPVGAVGNLTWEDWFEEVPCPDNTGGASYVFTLACNNLLCFKRWVSEARDIWVNDVLKYVCVEDEVPPMLYTVLPWDMTATC